MTEEKKLPLLELKGQPAQVPTSGEMTEEKKLPLLELKGQPAQVPSVMHTDDGTAVMPGYLEPGACSLLHVSGTLALCEELPFLYFDPGIFNQKGDVAFETLLQQLTCHIKVRKDTMTELLALPSGRQRGSATMRVVLLAALFGPHWKALLRVMYQVLVRFSTDASSGVKEFGVICAQFAMWLFFSVQERWLVTDAHKAMERSGDRQRYPLHDWPEFILAVKHYGDTKVVHEAAAVGQRSVYLQRVYEEQGYDAAQLVERTSMCGLVYIALLLVYEHMQPLQLHSFPTELEWLQISWNVSREKVGRNMWIIMGCRGLVRQSVERQSYAHLFNEHVMDTHHQGKKRGRPMNVQVDSDGGKGSARQLLGWKGIRFLPGTTALSLMAPEVAHNRNNIASFLSGLFWRPTHRLIEFPVHEDPTERLPSEALRTVDTNVLIMHHIVWQMCWCVPQDVARVLLKNFALYLESEQAPAVDVAVTLYGGGLHMIRSFAYRGITPLHCSGIMEYSSSVYRTLPLARWAYQQALHFDWLVPELGDDQILWWTPSMLWWAVQGGATAYPYLEQGLFDWKRWFHKFPLSSQLYATDLEQLVALWQETTQLSYPLRLYQAYQQWPWSTNRVEDKFGAFYHVIRSLEMDAYQLAHQNRGRVRELLYHGDVNFWALVWQRVNVFRETAREIQVSVLRDFWSECKQSHEWDTWLWSACTRKHHAHDTRVSVLLELLRTQNAGMSGITASTALQVAAMSQETVFFLEPWVYVEPSEEDQAVTLVTGEELWQWWHTAYTRLWDWIWTEIERLVFPVSLVHLRDVTGQMVSVEQSYSGVFLNHLMHSLLATVTQYIDQVINRVDPRGDVSNSLAFCKRLAETADPGQVDLQLLSRLDALVAVAPVTRPDPEAFGQLRHLIHILAAKVDAGTPDTSVSPPQNIEALDFGEDSDAENGP